MVNLPTKFEVSIFSRYGGMKCVKNAQNGGGYGSPMVIGNVIIFDRAHMISYSSLIETTVCVYLVPFSRYGELGLFVEIRQVRPTPSAFGARWG